MTAHWTCYMASDYGYAQPRVAALPPAHGCPRSYAPPEPPQHHGWQAQTRDEGPQLAQNPYSHPLLDSKPVYGYTDNHAYYNDENRKYIQRRNLSLGLASDKMPIKVQLFRRLIQAKGKGNYAEPWHVSVFILM